MLMSSCGEDGYGLCIAEIFLLFSMSTRRHSESREYSFLKYVEVPCLIDAVDEMLRCLCLRWSTDGKVDHSPGRGTGASDRGYLDVGIWFGMKSLQKLRGCVNELRANHAIQPFTRRIPWPLRRFFVKSIYNDRYFCLLQNVLTLVRSFYYNETVIYTTDKNNKTSLVSFITFVRFFKPFLSDRNNYPRRSKAA